MSKVLNQSAAEPDYDRLLRANLQRVFNEHDPDLRRAAIAELFAAEPIMYEPGAVVVGQEAIAEVAGRLLDQFGPDFTFVAIGSGLGHHGVGSLRWKAGKADGSDIVTGIDTAEVRDGRIARLWVLLDTPPA
jgi:hypothetical protein